MATKKKTTKKKSVKKKATKKKIEKKKEKVKEEKKLTNNHERVLRNILFFIGAVFIITILSYLIHLNSLDYEYEGVEFHTYTKGDLTFYHTTLPVTYQGESTVYNFYLRTNPKELKKIPFEGELYFQPDMVLEFPDSFACEGYGLIAAVNMNKLMEVIGIEVIRDENATCDEEGRYMYVSIIEGDETKVVQEGPLCYTIYTNGCEDILKSTERFMLEVFKEIQKVI